MPAFPHIRRALRQPFETGGIRLLQIIIPLLPRGAVVGLSRLAGQLAWLLPLREKQIGLKNIDAVFGNTKTVAEKRFILTSSFAAFTLTMLDIFWFSKNPEKRILKYVEIDPSFEVFFQNKANICITAHFGNWEIIPQFLALRGVDIASVAAPIKNKTIDQILIRQREKTGQAIIPRKGALRTLVGRLRKGGKVGFALDQNTSKKVGGIAVDLLGFPILSSAAPTALAYRTGTEILFGFCMPLPSGKYGLYSTGTLQPPAYEKGADSAAIALKLTQQILDHISAEIRERPEYWLWSYRHWRREPKENYPENYPDY